MQSRTDEAIVTINSWNEIPRISFTVAENRIWQWEQHHGFIQGRGPRVTRAVPQPGKKISFRALCCTPLGSLIFYGKRAFTYPTTDIYVSWKIEGYRFPVHVKPYKIVETGTVEEVSSIKFGFIVEIEAIFGHPYDIQNHKRFPRHKMLKLYLSKGNMLVYLYRTVHTMWS
jgi:hypothetical protein